MAASLMILTGRPNAPRKSKPTQPLPKLLGSAIGRLCNTAPGYPIETASYSHVPMIRLTLETICCGVILGPDGNSRAVLCPVARTFTCVPPTSSTSTFMQAFLPLQRVAHDCLRFIDDGIQVGLILEALRVNLIDVFRAGWTRRKPAAASHDF